MRAPYVLTPKRVKAGKMLFACAIVASASAAGRWKRSAKRRAVKVTLAPTSADK